MNIDFKKIPRVKTLSQYIELDQSLILKMANDVNAREISLITINQRNKKRKVIKSNSNTYKYILKVLAAFLNDNYETPECVCGYVKGKSIVSNSEIHLGKKIIIKADIKDFFYSIPIENIKNMFLQFSATEEIAELLSKLVTYDDVLYPGLITSPIISNIILNDFDNDFMKLANDYKCIYSRYADDITISSNDVYPSREEISKLLEKYNFSLNEKKFKIMKRGQTQVVTGLSVFDTTRPRIPRKIKKRIKTACFLSAKIPSERFAKTVPWCSMSQIDGLLTFYSKIEPEFVEKMKKLKHTGKYK